MWHIKGPVVPGFGRGSKVLGIPTANLREDAMDAVGDAVSGIYYGWASIGSSAATFMMVMSIGWNPFYDNEHRTCEPWILAEFDQVCSTTESANTTAANRISKFIKSYCDALILRISLCVVRE